MNRTIVSLTILAVSAAGSAAQGHGHAGGHHGGGHHGGGHHSGYQSGAHHGGGSHHVGGYGYWGGVPFGMGFPVQPAFNPGQFWLQTAQAAVQWEQARRLYIENLALGDQLLQQRKEMRAQRSSARRDAERQKRLTRQQPQRSNQAAVATEQREEMGQRNEFRSTTALSADGRIAWPALLCDDAYKAQRDRLEAVLAQRAAAASASLDRDDSRQVELSCKELLAKVTRHAGNANPNDWIDAKRFVSRLAAEAGHKPVQRHLAGR